LTPRAARIGDAPAIAAIYNEGIADRIATFETEPRSAEQVERWFDDRHPLVVVEGGDGAVLAFASSSTYRERECYAGIAEFAVYVACRHRGKVAGRLAMAAPIDAAAKAGFWKLVSRIFPESPASLALMARMGFRQVGIYQQHGLLDGQWRDCVIVERLLGNAAPQEAERDPRAQPDRAAYSPRRSPHPAASGRQPAEGRGGRYSAGTASLTPKVGVSLRSTSASGPSFGRFSSQLIAPSMSFSQFSRGNS
jgi:L-amino acid N-acyltransferase YncA